MHACMHASDIYIYISYVWRTHACVIHMYVCHTCFRMLRMLPHVTHAYIMHYIFIYHMHACMHASDVSYRYVTCTHACVCVTHICIICVHHMHDTCDIYMYITRTCVCMHMYHTYDICIARMCTCMCMWCTYIYVTYIMYISYQYACHTCRHACVAYQYV